jgi:hypothetical protein
MPSILEEKDAIRDLFARYCFYTDSGQMEKYAALFTEDCDWDGGAFGRHQGRANVLAKMKAAGDAATKLRHLTINSLIEINGDEAHATSYILLFGVGGEAPLPVFAGLYFDHLVKLNGQWLFKQRKIRTDFQEAVIKT